MIKLNKLERLHCFRVSTKFTLKFEPKVSHKNENFQKIFVKDKRSSLSRLHITGEVNNVSQC